MRMAPLVVDATEILRSLASFTVIEPVPVDSAAKVFIKVLRLIKPLAVAVSRLL